MPKKLFRSLLLNFSRLTVLVFTVWLTVGQYSSSYSKSEHSLEIKELSPVDLVLDAPVSSVALSQFISHYISFDWSFGEIIPDVPGLMTLLADERFHHFIERNNYYFFLSAKAP